MRRALALATRPIRTSPNPRVGAVIVRDDEVIAEGFHAGASHPHAEREALRDVDAAGSTVYVTLEPCSHQGRTPPCAPVLVDAGVNRVVVAIEDPDPRVSGRGIQILRAAGIDVHVGVLREEAQDLNAAYLHHRITGLPFVTLKLALTIDGRLAARDGSSRWISDPEARRVVHRRRAEVDGILVGVGTILADDPALNAREVPVETQPLRVIVDDTGRTPPMARIFRSGEGVVVATTEAAHETQTAWKEAGAEVVVLPRGKGGVDLGRLLEVLGRKGLTSVMCEGGAALASSLLREDLVQRLEIHRGAVLVGSGPMISDLGVRSMDEAPRFLLNDNSSAGNTAISIYERAS